MTNSTISKVKRINHLLQVYYAENGIKSEDYNDAFMNYCRSKKLINGRLYSAFMRKNEEPELCPYSQIDQSSDLKFPVPHGIYVPDSKRNHFIFYIMKHCYRKDTIPSTQCLYYIKSYVFQCIFK